MASEVAQKLASAPLLIKSVDMAEDIQQVVESLARESLLKFQLEKDIAAFMKNQMDEKYEKHWHVIVGKSFGALVTSESRHFMYFYIGGVAFLLFKSG